MRYWFQEGRVVSLQGVQAPSADERSPARWRVVASSSWSTLILVALLLGMGTWYGLDRTGGIPTPVLVGQVVGAHTGGFLTVRCKKGGAQTPLQARAQGQFTLDMGEAAAPCLLEWRPTDGPPLWGVALALEGAAPVEVSALSHLWVHFLRHMPWLHARMDERMPDWFVQAPVQALLQDTHTQRGLAQDHFLPALRCLGSAQGERLPATAGSAALLEALQGQGLLGPGGHYASTTLAVVVRAGLGTGQSDPPPCHWLLGAVQSVHAARPYPMQLSQLDPP
jgi:hypothetical protein